MKRTPTRDRRTAADRLRAGTERCARGVPARRAALVVLLALLIGGAGCAKYNTYFNAKRAFDAAETVREDALRRKEDPPKPQGQQKVDYETAIRKAQKILDDYPGHSLTDDALFLQGKAWHRLESYRMSIRKLDLLFTNFPQTPFLEEALYLQGLNHLLIGNLPTSQDFLDRLAKLYPGSKFRAETRKVMGDNAFVLEKWEAAAESYRSYLAQKEGLTAADRVGLKLATCDWELGRYEEASDVLQEVSRTSLSAEVKFQADLLLARVNIRLGQHELVDALVEQLEEDAGIYSSEGLVTLVAAENLVAQGRGQDASPLLENMPQEWKTPEVKTRAAEMLGYELLDRGDWEEAKLQFNEANKRRDLLEDPVRVRRLNGNLSDYLASENALADAQGEKVARLKLLQANSLLFGLNRPRMAADLYLQAAADSAADSSDAARALYGAMVAYRDHLSLPDSAAYAVGLLKERFPHSPQAFDATRTVGDPDLLGFLLARKEKEQEANFAALTPDELAALEEVGGLSVGGGSRLPVHSGLRRRMVYLSRRSNLRFDPPPEAVAALAARRAARDQQDQEDAGAPPPQGAAGPTPGAAAPGGVRPAGDPAPAAADSSGSVPPLGPQEGPTPAGPAGGETVGDAVDPASALEGATPAGGIEEASAAQDSTGGQVLEAEQAEEEKPKEAEEKKPKERKKEFDFLREPGP